MWHQHSGCRQQTYLKHASFFKNAGIGTCLNKFKAKTQTLMEKITPIPTPHYVTNFLIMHFNGVQRPEDHLL
jgi:hypothetical protein